MNLRIGTWNVAGFHTVRSNERFDYDPSEDLEYFARQIRDARLDVVCLQESQVNGSDSQARRLSALLDLRYVSETPGCPSHIDKGYAITTAILSGRAIVEQSYALLPQPSFELYINGKVVPAYDRYVHITRIDGYQVATMHPEPLATLGARYEAGAGKTLAANMDSQLSRLLRGPVVFAADFNMDNPALTLPATMAELNLREALPDEPTAPSGSTPDHILYDPAWEVIAAGIVPTRTDHYLCWAELSFKKTPG